MQRDACTEVGDFIAAEANTNDIAFTVIIHGRSQVEPEFPPPSSYDKTLFARSATEASTIACNFESRISQIFSLTVHSFFL